MLNIFKEYLIKVGFDIDNAAYQNLDRKLQKGEEVMAKFGKNFANSQGFKNIQAAFEKIQKAMAAIADKMVKLIGGVVTKIAALLGPEGVVVAAVVASMGL